MFEGYGMLKINCYVIIVVIESPYSNFNLNLYIIHIISIDFSSLSLLASHNCQKCSLLHQLFISLILLLIELLLLDFNLLYSIKSSIDLKFLKLFLFIYPYSSFIAVFNRRDDLATQLLID